jgi:pimeloyl-ACP methyl ester carboxylesterase
MQGSSLGGGVALQTAVRHPEMVWNLILVSTAHKSEDWYPEVRVGMRALNAEAARTMVGSPLYQAYFNTAPNPKGWTDLVIKTGKLVSQNYD